MLLLRGGQSTFAAMKKIRELTHVGPIRGNAQIGKAFLDFQVIEETRQQVGSDLARVAAFGHARSMRVIGQ